MLNHKQLFITGGTGSFGKSFVHYVLQTYPYIKKIVIYSRDEQKQFEMMADFAAFKEKLDYILGDIRDSVQLQKSMYGANIVVHAAAMKHVYFAEKNPMEAVKTNILGSQNLIDAAMYNGVEKVVALSTDKASDAINAYGATKLLLERLFVQADAQSPKEGTRFCVVRYGNIFATKGSVVPVFLQRKAQGLPLQIRDEKMTRFSMTVQESIELVLFALREGWGGEIIVPRLPSYRITDVAQAVASESGIELVGAQKGEKIHELLYSETESYETVRYKNYFIISPTHGHWNKKCFMESCNAKTVQEGEAYASNTNEQWLSVEEIRQLIEKEMQTPL